MVECYVVVVVSFMLIGMVMGPCRVAAKGCFCCAASDYSDR